ncbi:hypothetical protein [Xenorhabdus santafensis]|uniref:hypothetical protein n=1 Tax=Xenorhabdus santafensis TaxID=2582833 RepID=UPI0029E7E465|nr:hypothetical protein [Xenorhabdus sp. 12]
MTTTGLTRSSVSAPTITLLNSIQTEQYELIKLLRDCVESDASVGFIAPLEENEAAQYWQAVETDIASGHRLLLIASTNGEIAGSVQLSLCKKKMGYTAPKWKK